MLQDGTYLFFWDINGHLTYGHSLNTTIMGDVSPHVVTSVIFMLINIYIRNHSWLVLN